MRIVRFFQWALFILGGMGFQASAQEATQSLVRAEMSFAQLSRESTTKKAFVENLDSNAIVFNENGPIKGLPFWQSLKADSSKLFWWPEYAETDATGTFGYTSGGWQWRKSSMADTPSAYGHYNSLWIKNGKGVWKVMLDCGTSCGKYNYDPKAGYSTVQVATETDRFGDFDQRKLFDLENGFIHSFSADRVMAYKEYLSTVGRLDRTGHQPLHFKVTDYALCVKGLPDSLFMTPLGSMLSPKKDLCLVYGSLTVDGRKDTYLRIWRHEQEGWKIALEVLCLP